MRTRLLSWPSARDVKFRRAGVDQCGQLKFHQVEAYVAGRQHGAGDLERDAVQPDPHGRGHLGRIFERRRQPGRPVRLHFAQSRGEHLHARAGMRRVAAVQHQTAIGVEQHGAAIAADENGRRYGLHRQREPEGAFAGFERQARLSAEASKGTWICDSVSEAASTGKAQVSRRAPNSPARRSR